MIANALRSTLGDALWRHSLRRHRSNMGWRQAPQYERYLARCRANFQGDLPDIGDLDQAVREFQQQGVTSFRTPETIAIAEGIRRKLEEREQSGQGAWGARTTESDDDTYVGDLWQDFPEVHDLLKGPLCAFLSHYYRCPPKFYYGLCYRSLRRSDRPSGSQLWHSDSGPGICTNVMVYLSDVGPDDGPLQVLPWDDSLPMFLRQRAIMRQRLRDAGERLDKLAQREILCSYYEEAIESGPKERVRTMTGPIGTVVPFFNNSLHRGGFPQAGHTRRALVLHCYPSHLPTDWSIYDKEGLKKRGSYPHDPSEPF